MRGEREGTHLESETRAHVGDGHGSDPGAQLDLVGCQSGRWLGLLEGTGGSWSPNGHGGLCWLLHHVILVPSDVMNPIAHAPPVSLHPLELLDAGPGSARFIRPESLMVVKEGGGDAPRLADGATGLASRAAPIRPAVGIHEGEVVAHIVIGAWRAVLHAGRLDRSWRVTGQEDVDGASGLLGQFLERFGLELNWDRWRGKVVVHFHPVNGSHFCALCWSKQDTNGKSPGADSRANLFAREVDGQLAQPKATTDSLKLLVADDS